MKSPKAQVEIAPIGAALANAHAIRDITSVHYPEGIICPPAEMNIHAKNGRFMCVTLPFVLLNTHLVDMNAHFCCNSRTYAGRGPRPADQYLLRFSTISTSVLKAQKCVTPPV